MLARAARRAATSRRRRHSLGAVREIESVAMKCWQSGAPAPSRGECFVLSRNSLVAERNGRRRDDDGGGESDNNGNNNNDDDDGESLPARISATTVAGGLQASENGPPRLLCRACMCVWLDAAAAAARTSRRFQARAF
jgi:hypothetical protein